MKEKIIKLREDGKTYNEIVEILGCSKSTISYHCSKLEINESRKEKNNKIKYLLQKDDYFIPEENIVKEIVKLREEKKTYDYIAKELNLSKYSISKVCRKLNLIDVRKFGKISEYEISKIKELYEKTKSCIKVSNILKISKTTVLKYITVDKKEKLDEIDRKDRNSKGVVEWRKREKIKLVEYKGGKCEKCDYDKCTDALEFHHLDPNEKDFTISGKSWSFERLKKEVEKCILVCSNCHKEIHSEKNLVFSDLKNAPMA